MEDRVNGQETLVPVQAQATPVPQQIELTAAEAAVLADQDALSVRLKLQLANATLQLEAIRAQHQSMVQRTQQQDVEVQQRLVGLLTERGVKDPQNWMFDFKTMTFTYKA